MLKQEVYPSQTVVNEGPRESQKKKHVWNRFRGTEVTKYYVPPYSVSILAVFMTIWVEQE